MKIVNIDKENINIFQAPWKVSKKFSGRMCLMIITKNQGLTPSLENAVFEKPQGEGCQIYSPAFLGLIFGQCQYHLLEFLLFQWVLYFLQGTFYL